MRVQSCEIRGPLLGAAFVLLVGLLCQGAVRVSVLSPIKEEGPGGFVTHVFSVTNDGTASGTFLIETEVPEGWGLLGVPTGIMLAAGEEETLFITLSVPPGAVAGEYLLTLRAISQTDPADWASADAGIRVAPVNEVEVTTPNGESVAPARDSLFIHCCQSGKRSGHLSNRGELRQPVPLPPLPRASQPGSARTGRSGDPPRRSLRCGPRPGPTDASHHL